MRRTRDDETTAKKKPGFIRRWTKRLVKTALILTLVGIPTGYFVIPKIASSGWAKSHVESALTKASGAPVSVESLKMTWGDGLTATNVKGETIRRGRYEIEPSVKEIRFAPTAKSLVRSTVKASATLVEPSVVIRETLDEAATAEGAACTPRRCCTAKKELRVESLAIQNGRVVFDNPAFNQEVVLENLNVKAAVQAREGRINLVVTELTGTLNGGALTASGTLSIEPGKAESKVAIEGSGVEANDLIARALKHLVPMFETAAPGGEIRGKLDLKFEAEAKGDDVQSMLRSAAGHGTVAFGGSLSGARLMAAIGERFEDAALRELEFSAVTANVTIDGRRVLHANTVAASSWGHVVLNGTASCADGLDLLVMIDPNLLQGRQGRSEEARRIISERGGLRVTGTLQHPIVE